MKNIIIVLAVVFVAGIFLFIGSGFFGALMIALSVNCKVEINDKFIASGCGLGNGVYFEKLVVDEFDSLGIPAKYHATTRFHCYNPGTGDSDYSPSKIYFDKRNKHYRWGADTVNILYERKGRNLRAIGFDSVSNEFYTKTIVLGTFGNHGFENAPVEFEKSTWYYVDIKSQRVSTIYVYVDDQMNFNVFKMDSGISPI